MENVAVHFKKNKHDIYLWPATSCRSNRASCTLVHRQVQGFSRSLTVQLGTVQIASTRWNNRCSRFLRGLAVFKYRTQRLLIAWAWCAVPLTELKPSQAVNTFTWSPASQTEELLLQQTCQALFGIIIIFWFCFPIECKMNAVFYHGVCHELWLILSISQ